MLRIVMVAALLLSLVGLSGCSKNLTESSAVKLVQKYADEKTEHRELGRAVVDSCDHLLLQTETIATANCKVHVELTDAGKSHFRMELNGATGSTSFGKTPDGTWVAVSWQRLDGFPAVEQFMK